MLRPKTQPKTRSGLSPAYDISNIVQEKFSVTLDEKQAIYLIALDNAEELKKFYQFLKRNQFGKVFRVGTGKGFSNFCAQYDGPNGQCYIIIPKHVLGLIAALFPRYADYLKKAPTATGEVKKEVESLIDMSVKLKITKSRSFKAKLEKVFGSIKTEEERVAKGEETLLNDYPTNQFRTDSMLPESSSQEIPDELIATNSTTSENVLPQQAADEQTTIYNFGCDVKKKYDVSHLFSNNRKMSMVFVASEHEADVVLRQMRRNIREGASVELKKKLTKNIQKIVDTELCCIVFPDEYSRYFASAPYTGKANPLSDPQKVAMTDKYQQSAQSATSKYLTASSLFAGRIDKLNQSLQSDTTQISEDLAQTTPTSESVQTMNQNQVQMGNEKTTRLVTPNQPIGIEISQESNTNLSTENIARPRAKTTRELNFRSTQNSKNFFNERTSHIELSHGVPPQAQANPFTTSNTHSYQGAPSIFASHQTEQVNLLKQISESFCTTLASLMQNLIRFKNMGATEKTEFLKQMLNTLDTLLYFAHMFAHQYNQVLSPKVTIPTSFDLPTSQTNSFSPQDLIKLSQSIFANLMTINNTAQSIRFVDAQYQADFFVMAIQHLTMLRRLNSKLIDGILKLPKRAAENQNQSYPRTESDSTPTSTTTTTTSSATIEEQTSANQTEQHINWVDERKEDALPVTSTESEEDIIEIKARKRKKESIDEPQSTKRPTVIIEKMDMENPREQLPQSPENTEAVQPVETTDVAKVTDRTATIPSFFKARVITPEERLRLESKPLDEETIQQTESMLLQTSPVTRLLTLLNINNEQMTEIKKAETKRYIEQTSKLKAKNRPIESIEDYVKMHNAMKIAEFCVAHDALSKDRKNYPKIIDLLHSAFKQALKKKDKETAYVIACYLNHAIELAANVKRFNADKQKKLAYGKFTPVDDNPDEMKTTVKKESELIISSKNDRLSHLFKDASQHFMEEEPVEKRFILQAMVNARMMVDALKPEQVDDYVQEMLDAFKRETDISLRPSV